MYELNLTKKNYLIVFRHVSKCNSRHCEQIMKDQNPSIDTLPHSLTYTHHEWVKTNNKISHKKNKLDLNLQ